MLMKTKPISDKEVMKIGEKEFVPITVDSGAFMDNIIKITKGSLFDPDVFGPTELISLEEARSVNKCGKYGAYYRLSEETWNPLYIYNLFRELGRSDVDAYKFAIGSVGLASDVEITKDLTPVPFTDPKCHFVGDTMARIVAALFEKDFPEEGIKMNTIYIVPPRLRPICRVSDNNKRLCVSDLNWLYRLIILRNDRLGGLLKMGAHKLLIDHSRALLNDAILRLMINDDMPDPMRIPVFDDAPKDGIEKADDKRQRPFKSLMTLMTEVSYKDRELIATAMHISTDTTSVVTQVRIDKELLDRAENILDINDTDLSEVVSIVMQEIVNKGEIPSFINKALAYNRMPYEDWLFHSIFGQYIPE